MDKKKRKREGEKWAESVTTNLLCKIMKSPQIKTLENYRMST